MILSQALERVRARLGDRRWAYRTLFMHDGKPTPAAAIVLRDLSKYCYAARPTLKVSQVTQQSDPLSMAFAEGRRDVWNRIWAMCGLTDDQIHAITQERDSND